MCTKGYAKDEASDNPTNVGTQARLPNLEMTMAHDQALQVSCRLSLRYFIPEPSARLRPLVGTEERY